MARLYWRDTATEPGTNALGTPPTYDLSETQGSPVATITATTNLTTASETLRWQREVGTTITGTSFPVSVVINQVGSVSMRWRVQRVNSAGVVQASSAYGTTHITTGTFTDTLTLSTTWAAGDWLRLSFEHFVTGGHGNQTVGVEVQNASTYVDATIDANVTVEPGAGAATAAGFTPTITNLPPQPDAVSLYAQVFASDGTTALTNRVLVAADASLTTAYQDFAPTFTIQGTPSVADWNGAQLKVEWEITQANLARTVRVTTLDARATVTLAPVSITAGLGAVAVAGFTPTVTATGPVTVNLVVPSGDDDAEEMAQTSALYPANNPAGYVYTFSTDLDLNYESDHLVLMYGGVRFTNVAVPQGATIASATLKLKSNGLNSGTDFSVVVRGDDTDNALGFTADADGVGSASISSRPSTTATVTWTDANAWTTGVDYSPPDLAAVIQEIVGRAGWASGNALALVLEPTSGTSYRSAYTYNSGAANAPTLSITYEEAQSSGTTVTANVAAVTAAGLTATVSFTDDQTVTANAAAATVSALTLTVAAPNHKTVTAGVGAVVVTGFAPVVTTYAFVTSGLIRHYRLLQGADAQVAYDDSANAAHGYRGDSTGADARDGDWTSEGFLAAGDDRINIPIAGLPTGDADLTMMVAARLDAGTTGNRNVVAYGDNANRRLPHIHLTNDVPGVTVGSYFGDINIVKDPINDVPTVATWRYGNRLGPFAGELRGDVDELAASNTTTLTDANWGTSYARMGSTGADYFIGTIFQVLIYDRRLTDAEVRQNYAALYNELGQRGVALTAPSQHVTVSAETGAVIVAGYVTTVTATADALVEATTGTASVAEFDATVSVTDHITVTAGAASASVAPLNATVTTTADVPIAANASVASAAGLTATITATNDISVVANVDSVSAAGLTASVSVAQNVTIQAAAATAATSGQAATVATPVVVVANTASVTTAGFAPTILRDVTVTAQAAAGAVAGLTPSVVASANETLVANAAAVTLAAADASVAVTDDITVTANTAAATVAVLPLTVEVAQDVTVQANAAAVTVAGQTVSVANDVTVTASVASVSAAGLTASIQNDVTVSAQAAATSVASPLATVTTTADQTFVADAGAVSVTAFASTVAVTANVTVTAAAGSVATASFTPLVAFTEYETVSLIPMGDVSASGIVDQVGGTTNLYAAVDDGFGSADEDVTYLRNLTSSGGSVTFSLSDLNGNMGAVTLLRVRARAKWVA